MGGATEDHGPTAMPAARLAGLAILVGSLLVAVLLLGARADSAAGAPTPASGTPVPSPEEELAEEVEEARSQCTLRSARVHAVTRRKRLKLTIGYTSSEPTTAKIEIRVGKRRLAVLSTAEVSFASGDELARNGPAG